MTTPDAEPTTKAEREFPVQVQQGAEPHPLRIPWEVAELAYSVYAARYGTDQSLEVMAKRGGFGPGEMDIFLPDWRERCSVITKLRADIERLEAESRAFAADVLSLSASLGKKIERVTELEAERDRLLELEIPNLILRTSLHGERHEGALIDCKDERCLTVQVAWEKRIRGH